MTEQEKFPMNTAHRKNLPGTQLDYFDAREAVDALEPGAWAKLPYTSRVYAEHRPQGRSGNGRGVAGAVDRAQA